MSIDAPRRLRADAARNSEKLLRAAREVYAANGPDALLEDIARRAGVGIATLYRHFPDKAVLIKAALDQSFTEDLVPVIDRALVDEDPRHGLLNVVETTVSLMARHYNMVTAGHDAGALTTDASTRFFDTLMPLIHRGRQAGVIRADLVLDDIRRIMVMLISVLWTMDPSEDGWRRYVVLVLDGLSPRDASPLPPPVPVRLQPHTKGGLPTGP